MLRLSTQEIEIGHGARVVISTSLTSLRWYRLLHECLATYITKVIHFLPFDDKRCLNTLYGN